MSGTLQTRIRNMVSWYISIANKMVQMIHSHSGMPNHSRKEANT